MRTFSHVDMKRFEVQGELAGAEGSMPITFTVSEAVRTLIDFMTIETSEGVLGEFSAE